MQKIEKEDLPKANDKQIKACETFAKFAMDAFKGVWQITNKLDFYESFWHK